MDGVSRVGNSAAGCNAVVEGEQAGGLQWADMDCED